MIDPFEYPDEVLYELSSPDLDMETEDYADFISQEDYFHGRNHLSFDDILPVDRETRTHEDIKRYQQSLAESSGETKPSVSKMVYWLYAESTKKHKEPTKWSGKWLIFCPQKQIDDAWEQVKDATERGLLGGKSKVSTRKVPKGDDHVICVYSYSWKDEKDVMRIRQELRDLGFEKPLSYKTDEDTLAGKYTQKGKKIAKYWE